MSRDATRSFKKVPMDLNDNEALDLKNYASEDYIPMIMRFSGRLQFLGSL